MSNVKNNAIAAWTTAAIAFIGMLFTAGAMSQRLSTAEIRIDKQEKQLSEMSTKLNEMGGDLKVLLERTDPNRRWQ